MAKASLRFDLEDHHDRLAHKRAISATDAYLALNSIANDIFRPARKHGYNDERLRDAYEDERISKIIGLLEEKFYEILKEHNVNLDDLE